jgi:hypothetical protein
MIDQLCFNICKLEDSRLANADIERSAITNQTEYFRLFAVQFSLLVESSLLRSRHW